MFYFVKRFRNNAKEEQVCIFILVLSEIVQQGHHLLLVNPPLHNPVLKLRHLGVDPSIGAAGVSEGDNPRQFAHTVSVRADEGAAAVSVAGGVARAAGTHHVLRDVAFEDGLAVGCRVDRDLDPLQMVRQEETSPCGQSPACRVANCLWRDLGISRLKELHWLHVGVCEVEWRVDGDKADVMIKGRGVPAPVELHAGDGPGLVSGLQVPVVGAGNDPVKESQLSLAAVGGGDDLVPVHDGAAADVAAQRLQRDLKVCLALLLGLALASTTFKPTSPVMTQETVDHVNNNAKWTASLEWVGEMTIEEAKSMVGTDLNDYNPYPKRDFGALLDYTSIPTSFDSREQWPGCVHDILNQERCGSCWAFAGSESLSDRYCVQKQMDVVLSPQWLVSCDTGNMGSHGIPTLACDPYVSGQGDSHSGECNITYNPDTCDEETMYKATNIGGFTSASDIQMEIMRGG